MEDRSAAGHDGRAAAWKTDPLLVTTGVPPFGANGLAFNNAQTAMFVANTGNDSVVKIDVSPGLVAGAAHEFTNSINGADGLIIDEDDNLCDEHGAPKNLLFPASLVRYRDHIYVTNLALDLRLFGHNTVDAQWVAAVKQHTVSKIPAHIPPVHGLK